MKIMCKYVEHINDELSRACEYAEKYIEYKNTNPQWAKMYHEMSTQELFHAQNFKEMAETEYLRIADVYMPDDMVEKWEHCMKKYADDSAKIRVMLSM